MVAADASMLANVGIGWLGRRLDASPPPLILSPLANPGLRSRWRAVLHPVLVTAVLLEIWTLSMDAAGLSPFFAKRPGDV